MQRSRAHGHRHRVMRIGLLEASSREPMDRTEWLLTSRRILGKRGTAQGKNMEWLFAFGDSVIPVVGWLGWIVTRQIGRMV